VKTNGHGPNGHTNGHANGNGHAHDPFDDPPPGFHDDEPSPVNQPQPWAFTGDIPTLSWWLRRELQPRDNLLGELISTTSRILLVGPTGLGKTNFLLAFGLSLATGLDFLHWRAVRPVRVLYVDGEMPSRLIKRRLQDTVRRRGCQSDNLVVLSREDYPDMPPLNTPKGQKFLDDFMAWAGGFEFNIFDNIQALLTGDMKEPEQWATMLNWIRDLSRRAIGQLWAHHTGRDESHGYGDSTRDWGLDTTMLMERIEDPADIAFNLKFPKARERTPDNRSDFEDATITLAGDQWTSSRGRGTSSQPRGGRPKGGKLEDIALRALDEAIAKGGTTPLGHPKIPPDTYCVTVDMWKAYYQQVWIGDPASDTFNRTFRRYREKLQADQKIGSINPWIWRI
jgi:hypothetical protein